MELFRTTIQIVSLFLFVSHASLPAQEIIGQARLGGSLYSIDPTSGDSTFIASPPFAPGLIWTGLAYDINNILYSTNGDDIHGWDVFMINPDTAQTTLVAHVDINNINCMAFDSNNTLYFLNKRDYPLSISEYDLYTLDLATGIPTFIGYTGIEGLDMLTMDFHDDVLYVHPYSLGLSTVDTNTGLVTELNPAHDGITFSLTGALCFDDLGTLYYLDTLLWLMDPESATASIVDWVPPFPLWGECVFREGPTPNFSLTLSGFTGSPMKVKIAGATPFGQVAILAANGSGGPTTIPAGFPCAGVDLHLNSGLRLLGIGTADQDGYVTLGPDMMPAGARGNLRIQAVDLSSCDITNKVIVTF